MRSHHQRSHQICTNISEPFQAFLFFFLISLPSRRQVLSIVDLFDCPPGSKMDAFSWGESHNVISFLWNGQIKAKGLNFLSDSWSLPFVLLSICLFLQIIYTLLHFINTFRKPGSVVETESSLTDTTTCTFSHSLKKKVKSLGGWTIYSFMVARLFGCLILFALSVNSLLRCQKNHPGVDTIFKHLFVGCPEGFMALTFVNPFLSSSFVIIPDAMIDSSSTAL